MKKVVYCCDGCGDWIPDYDPAKDSIFPVMIDKEDLEKGESKIWKRDVCLHCLATVATMACRIAGNDFSRHFIGLIDKRLKKVKS